MFATYTTSTRDADDVGAQWIVRASGGRSLLFRFAARASCRVLILARRLICSPFRNALTDADPVELTLTLPSNASTTLAVGRATLRVAFVVGASLTELFDERHDLRSFADALAFEAAWRLNGTRGDAPLVAQTLDIANGLVRRIRFRSFCA